MSGSIIAKNRGLIFASTIFWFFFVLHIIFATMELWFLFNLVAISIFFISHFHSLIALYLSRLEDNSSKIFVIKLSTFFSIVYSIGYWYAVNEMSFEIWVFIAGMIPLLISILLLRSIITDNWKYMTSRRCYVESIIYS